MSKNDHITALFVGGLYYCMIGEDATADMLWRTAADILQMQVAMVGDA